jgi:hypothetical protein
MGELADNVVRLDQSYWTATPIDEASGGRAYTSAAAYVYDNWRDSWGGHSPRTAWLASTALGVPYVPGGAGNTVWDDFGMVGNAFTMLHYAYWPGSAGAYSQTVGFFAQTAGGGVGTTLAVYGVTGLPGQVTPGYGWLITLTLPTVTSPNPNIWGATIFNKPWDTPLGGPAGPWIGSHTTACNYAGVATSWPGNLMWALGVPEPMTIGLLAIGGLLALRRRR